MRPLPYDDPGQPDVSSPARFLIWTGRQQIPTLLLGVVYGVIWMVAQALVPAAIGRGLQTGVADGDLVAAAEWSLVVLGLALIQAVFGILRHRVAVANWLAASFRAMQLLGRHSSQVGVAIRRRLPTGEIVAAATNDALRLGGAFDVTARLVGGRRVVRRRRGAAAAHLRAARPGRARSAYRRWCCCSVRCCARCSGGSTTSARSPAS